MYEIHVLVHSIQLVNFLSVNGGPYRSVGVVNIWCLEYVSKNIPITLLMSLIGSLISKYSIKRSKCRSYYGMARCNHGGVVLL